MQMQKCKTWSRCICIVQKMHLHDVIAGIKRFILSPRLRASVYALGSDMKINGGTFPNSSVGDCFLPSPLHNFLLRPFSCCLPVNMHAGFLIRPLLDTNPPSSTIEDVLRKTLVLTRQAPCGGRWDIGGCRAKEKKLILRLKMFLQFKTED